MYYSLIVVVAKYCARSKVKRILSKEMFRVLGTVFRCNERSQESIYVMIQLFIARRHYYAYSLLLQILFFYERRIVFTFQFSHLQTTLSVFFPLSRREITLAFNPLLYYNETNGPSQGLLDPPSPPPPPFVP